MQGEDEDETIDDIKTVYSTIWDVCKMPRKHRVSSVENFHVSPIIMVSFLFADMRQFIAVLLIAKIGFIANEAVTPLKLIDKGLHKEDLALSVCMGARCSIFVSWRVMGTQILFFRY